MSTSTTSATIAILLFAFDVVFIVGTIPSFRIALAMEKEEWKPSVMHWTSQKRERSLMRCGTFLNGIFSLLQFCAVCEASSDIDVYTTLQFQRANPMHVRS